MTTSSTSAETVRMAVMRLFGARDASAIDDHFGPVYTQHSALGADGLEGLRGLFGRLPESFGYELVRLIADDDLVVTQGLYSGFGSVPMAGFDVWRLDAAGRIVEHWDALAPVSAVTQVLDGARTPGVAQFTDLSRDHLAALLSGDSAPVAAEEHGTVWGLAPAPLERGVVRQLIADGDFVFTRSEGSAGAPVIINDLWRFEGGELAEHWGLIATVPEQLPHANGVF